MRLQITPSTVSGTFSIPPSKSQTVRAILFAAMATGESTLTNVLLSPDTEKLLCALKQLGVDSRIEGDKLLIKGSGGVWKKPTKALDLGNSGIALRFLTALAALSKEKIVLTGDASLGKRQMGPLLEAITKLQVEVHSHNGHAPITVKGPLKSGFTTIFGGDSQPVSALLLAGSFAEWPISITVNNPVEIPWVQLTLSWLDRFHLPYTQENFTSYRVPGGGKIEGFHYNVPGDFSTTAFPLAAALICSTEATVGPLDFADPQGDKEILPLFEKMGAVVKKSGDQVTLLSRPLSGIDVDLNGMIDALPILATLGCFAKGKTRLYNVAEARDKECDRIHCMATELQKMGAKLTETKDSLTIYESPLHGAELESHQDHRVAMALSLAALGAKGVTTVQQIDCIQKSYPTFITDFQERGALWQTI